MFPSKRQILASAAILAVLGWGALVSACGGGNDAPAAPRATEATFDPANFGNPASSANPYLPLKPGTQWVRVGATSVGSRRVPHQVTTTVTDVYREINGVRTVAVLDHEVDGGQISQESLDYLAEDKDGNLWYLGGYTEEFQGGRYISALDAWLSGVKGAKAGLLVPAHPKAGSPPYAVAQPDAEEGDIAEVIKVGAKRCVPFKCLSGGEAQRASLAVALANQPELLLADEVTAELDSANADRVVEVILNASRDRGLTVLMVTHSGELAARTERRLRVVDGGVIEA